MATTRTSRIKELSSMIDANVNIIDVWYNNQGVASPSFDEDYPENLPPEIHQARNAVLIATDELTDLMLGPRNIAECQPPQHTSLIGIQAISRWGVADHVQPDEEISFTELAAKCKVPEHVFVPIIRQAMSRHIFKEPRQGFVAHTAASKLYINPTALHDYLSIALDDIWPSAAHMLDALEKWNYSQEANKTGFNLAKDTEDSFFGSMKVEDKRQKAFANTMSYMQSRHGFGSAPSHLLSTFDWNSAKKVVDVGGGLGDTGAFIVKNTSKTIVVVQDLPDVISQAQEKLSAEVKDRLELLSHNFFDEQPVKDADVFFLRWILHDWSDEQAVKILKALIPALKKGSHVIIQEFIVPDSGTVPFYFEKTIRCMDLAMKASFNSGERTINDWTALFILADARFKLDDVQVGGGQGLAVLRFSWE